MLTRISSLRRVRWQSLRWSHNQLLSCERKTKAVSPSFTTGLFSLRQIRTHQTLPNRSSTKVYVTTKDVDNQISRVEAITGHIFKNKLLCAEALQMAEPNFALRVAGVTHFVNRNRDLELVGDAVMNSVLVKMWYEARDHNGERPNLAAWTEMRNDLVSNTKLAKRGIDLGLDELIIRDGGTPKPSDNMVANTFEAVLGAISMDSGERSFGAVRDALQHMGFFEHPLLAVISNFQSITTGPGTTAP